MTKEDFKQRVIEKTKADIIQDVDGFFYFGPDKGPGFFSAEFLRVVADELDSLNKPWNDQIDDYFGDQPDSDAQALSDHLANGQEPF